MKLKLRARSDGLPIPGHFFRNLWMAIRKLYVGLFFKALSTFISIHEMPASQTSVHCAIVNA